VKVAKIRIALPHDQPPRSYATPQQHAHGFSLTGVIAVKIVDREFGPEACLAAMVIMLIAVTWYNLPRRKLATPQLIAYGMSMNGAHAANHAARALVSAQLAAQWKPLLLVAIRDHPHWRCAQI
jgi:hypothetical protein